MKDLIKYGLPYLIFFIVPIIVASILDARLSGLGVGLLTSLAASYYFNLDNPHQAFKNSTIIALVIWISTIYLSGWLHLGSWLPALAAGVLAYVYFQRFRAREEKLWIDYLKLAGVVALLSTNYLSDATPFICMYLAFIYLLDRLIIRRQMNKTTQIVTFCFMGLLCLSMLVYSYIKADEAEKAAMMAKVSQEEALRQKEEADHQRSQAMQAMAEANRQAALARQIIEDCESNK